MLFYERVEHDDQGGDDGAAPKSEGTPSTSDRPPATSESTQTKALKEIESGSNGQALGQIMRTIWAENGSLIHDKHIFARCVLT